MCEERKNWLAPRPEEDWGRERSEGLAEALARLPDKQRTVIVLKVYEEMTFADIAAVLRISANTAASRYRYGVEKLRQQMRSDEP